MLDGLLDLLFPHRSLGGTPGALITPAERAALRPIPLLLDARTVRRRGVLHLDRVAAGCLLDASPLVRTALHRFKYRRMQMLGDELTMYLAAAWPLLAADDAVLCPVPLHWTRFCERGFNQSVLLARRHAVCNDLIVRCLLRRRRATGTQTKRTRTERQRAMRDAFAVRRQRLPAHVVLIDDVATTFSTLDACACALKQAGVRRVDALVVALG